MRQSREVLDEQQACWDNTEVSILLKGREHGKVDSLGCNTKGYKCDVVFVYMCVCVL